MSKFILRFCFTLSSLKPVVFLESISLTRAMETAEF